MRRLLVVLMLCIPLPLLAQGFDYKDIDIEVAFKEAKGAEKAALARGEKADIQFTFTIPFGYSLTTDDKQPGIKVLNNVPFTFGKISKPKPSYRDAVGGHYLGEVTLTIPIQTIAAAQTGEYEVVFGFILQTCDEEGGMCFFPTAAKDIQQKLTIRITD